MVESKLFQFVFKKAFHGISSLVLLGSETQSVIAL